MLHEYIESKSPLTPRERNLITGAWIAAHAVCVECKTRVAEQRDEAAASEHSGAEKIYSTKALIRDLTNALENGYETLGDTDIGDLLLDCEADDEGQQLAPS